MSKREIRKKKGPGEVGKLKEEENFAKSEGWAAILQGWGKAMGGQLVRHMSLRVVPKPKNSSERGSN